MIYYSSFKVMPLNKTFMIAKNNQGVCNISFSSDENFFIKELSSAGTMVIKSHARLAKEIKQLQEFFAGKRRKFTMKVVQQGTKLQEAVWEAISKIPFGRVVSYSDLAKMAKYPKAIRAVAGACGKNFVPIVIPCHRVVAKNGLGGFGGGIELKKKMLKLEKIIID
jgi:O-6-methylguanine DNA methyltransferase